MSETVWLTEEQRRELALLDFTPNHGRCEVRWRRSPADCGKDADGLVKCQHCGFSVTSSRVCWARTLLLAVRGERAGLKTTCVQCHAAGRLLDVFMFWPFDVVAS